jgi:hypothetical protein
MKKKKNTKYTIRHYNVKIKTQYQRSVYLE